jgi:hypothetical protein
MRKSSAYLWAVTKAGTLTRIASFKKVCEDIRVTGYDSTEDLFFAACGEGGISFVQACDAGRFQTVGKNVATLPGAKLLAFITGENKRIFLGGPAPLQGTTSGLASVLIVARQVPRGFRAR